MDIVLNQKTLKVRNLGNKANSMQLNLNKYSMAYMVSLDLFSANDIEVIPLSFSLASINFIRLIRRNF